MLRASRALTARRTDFAALIAASLTQQQNLKRQAVLSEVVRGRGDGAGADAEPEGPWGARLEWVEGGDAAVQMQT